MFCCQNPFAQNLSFQAASLLNYLVSSAFHDPSGFLFIFCSRYYFTIGLGTYLDLPACIWHIRTRKPSRTTQDTSQQPSKLRLRGCHALWLDISGVFTFFGEAVRGPHSTSPLGYPQGIRFDLFRFRSPLLTESRLFSFPPGTKMFYFPGFPFPCGNSAVYWTANGCPIEESRGQRLHATNPSLSQLVTLFIGAQAKISTK